MWIMTSYGIIMPAIAPQEIRNRKHPEWRMQIRGRDRGALVKVRERLIALGHTASKIRDTRDRDYEWRFLTEPDSYAHLIAREIVDIDYEKFKPTTEDPGGGGPELHELYTLLWFRIAEFYDSPILDRYERMTRPRKR